MPRCVFISGASSGIGASLARHYAREGATLGLVARRSDLLSQLAAELGSAVVTYHADVADISAMRAAAVDFVARHGAPDIVIANAGISIGTDSTDADDLPALDRVLRTNVLGIATTISPFVTPMRARGDGILVGIASVAGFRGLPGAGAYSASKAAVITWLESLRVELHGTGISVVTICPGYVATPMTQTNPYRMPFLLSVDEAVKRIARAIDSRGSQTVIPWQMAIVSRAMRLLPNWLYGAIAAGAPRKPRRAPQ
jgi:short-subunit dehydrogenase